MEVSSDHLVLKGGGCSFVIMLVLMLSSAASYCCGTDVRYDASTVHGMSTHVSWPGVLHWTARVCSCVSIATHLGGKHGDCCA